MRVATCRQASTRYLCAVEWLIDRNVFALAVVIYGVSSIYSVFLWRRGFREDNRVSYFLLLAGAGFHTTAMFMRGFRLDRCPVNNLYEAIAFVTWTIVATYLVIGMWRRLRFLGAFASPILCAIGVFALMPALDVRGTQPNFSNGWSSLHAALILLAYGAFGLSSVAALMYLTQDHDLKFHKLRAVFSMMPPIQRLESVVLRSMILGFILLTIGLLMAPWLLFAYFGVYFTPEPKTLWSIFVWVLYAIILGMARGSALGGRKISWAAMAAFVFVLLTFWGFNLLSSIHNP